MQRNELERRAYAKPAVEIITAWQESLLQRVSGQHNPGHHGTGPSGAKQGFFDEEEEEEEENALTEERMYEGF